MKLQMQTLHCVSHNPPVRGATPETAPNTPIGKRFEQKTKLPRSKLTKIARQWVKAIQTTNAKNSNFVWSLILLHLIWFIEILLITIFEWPEIWFRKAETCLIWKSSLSFSFYSLESSEKGRVLMSKQDREETPDCVRKRWKKKKSQPPSEPGRLIFKPI